MAAASRASRSAVAAAAAVGLSALLAPIWEASRARSYGLERQNMSPEEGRYTWSDYEALMHTIARDNAVDPGGYPATLRAFDALPDAPDSILEVGPGSGDFSRLLAARYPNSSVLGIDASDFSIRVARASGDGLPNLRFEVRSSAELSEPPKSFDVLTTTFVNHEIFPDADFVEFLRRVRVVGRKAFIFNDFVRSFGCLTSMSLLRSLAEYGRMLPGVEAWLPGDLSVKAAVFLSQPPPVLEFILDAGFQSMKRSFTVEEYHSLFGEAGYPKGSLTCSRGEGFYWQDFFGASCRLTCTADLAPRAAPAA